MTTCCARLSKWYMITTNSLFFCLGIAFIALGVIGNKDGFNGATLFPDNTFKYLAILGAIICVAAVIGIIGAFVRNRVLTYIYMIIILCALVFQVIIGVQVYRKAADYQGYLSDLWSSSSSAYRLNIQNQFSCCGFQTSTDNYILSDTCTGSATNTTPSCASALSSFVKSNFSKMYYAVFAALALELLALTNAITMICSGSPEEEERRKHRKSGIRLDDMTADTPTTLVGSEEYKYFTSHDDHTRNNRYDSYDMYRHNNHSNTYSDTYNGHTLNNNRHGNGGGTYY